MSEIVKTCERCGATFSVGPHAHHAKYCHACRKAMQKALDKSGNVVRLLGQQTASLRSEADARRRAMHAWLRARDAVAPKCRVTVELRNGVRVETRGTVGGGMCLGVNRSMLPHLKVDRHLWGLMH